MKVHTGRASSRDAPTETIAPGPRQTGAFDRSLASAPDAAPTGGVDPIERLAIASSISVGPLMSFLAAASFSAGLLGPSGATRRSCISGLTPRQS